MVRGSFTFASTKEVLCPLHDEPPVHERVSGLSHGCCFQRA